MGVPKRTRRRRRAERWCAIAGLALALVAGACRDRPPAAPSGRSLLAVERLPIQDDPALRTVSAMATPDPGVPVEEAVREKRWVVRIERYDGAPVDPAGIRDQVLDWLEATVPVLEVTSRDDRPGLLESFVTYGIEGGDRGAALVELRPEVVSPRVELIFEVTEPAAAGQADEASG